MTWADVNGNGYKYTPEFFGVKVDTLLLLMSDTFFLLLMLFDVLS